MKFLLSVSTVMLIVVFSFVQGGLTSCTKDTTIYDTVTVTKTDTITVKDTVTVNDTITIKDTMLTEDMLTAHSWKLFEVRGVVEGSIIYYQRGGPAIDNTESFDNEHLAFYANHTGLLVDNAGASHVMSSWAFANPEHTKLVFTLYNNSTIQSDYTYDNIRYKNGNLYYDDYFYDNYAGVDAHAQEIRIPE